MHLDLPGMPAEREHQKRGLADQRDGKPERHDGDRTAGIEQRDRDHGKCRASARICDDVTAQQRADHRQHGHMDEAKTRQCLCDGELKRA